MAPADSRGRAHVLKGLTLGLLLVSLWPLYGAATLSDTPQKREKLRYENAEFYVEHRTTATADDLGMPFYPGAAVRTGFVYILTDLKDKPLNRYAMASLASDDDLQKVAEYYSRQLPGRPKAEQVKDAKGDRWVLGLASKDEVKVVTLRPRPKGCEIELVRAATPQKLEQPSGTPPPPPGTPNRPSGPRRPGAPGQEA